MPEGAHLGGARRPLDACEERLAALLIDVAAKHETSCIMGRGIQRRGKYDAVGHHLRNTPSERYIGQIKQERAQGPRALPGSGPRTLLETSRTP